MARDESEGHRLLLVRDTDVLEGWTEERARNFLEDALEAAGGDVESAFGEQPTGTTAGDIIGRVARAVSTGELIPVRLPKWYLENEGE